MRILHCFLILAFALLLKHVHCDSKVTSYILAVQWPIGVCSGNSGIQCNIKPVPTEFKIHGLWPQPEGVPATEAFHPNTIAGISSDLNKNWPSVQSPPDQQTSYNLKLWEHEWTVHGKYSEMGVLAYFQKTLELFKDVGQGLKAKLDAVNIKPTTLKTYKLKAIEDALSTTNGGFSVTIICNQRNTSDKKQIQEVRFRYTKNFNKQNNNVASSTCGTADSDVMFPA